MRAVDIGKFHKTVAVQIGRANRGQPAKPLPDPWQMRDGRQAFALNAPKGHTRAQILMALNGDNLGLPVAIHIPKTRRQIFKHNRPPPFRRNLAPPRQADNQTLPFQIIAQNPMRIARSRSFIARRDDLGGHWSSKKKGRPA